MKKTIILTITILVATFAQGLADERIDTEKMATYFHNACSQSQYRMRVSVDVLIRDITSQVGAGQVGAKLDQIFSRMADLNGDGKTSPEEYEKLKADGKYQYLREQIAERML